MAGDLRSLPPGFIISDYRIERVLGQGGFGITYLAMDTMLNRRVAIKEYYPREFAVRDGLRTIRAAGTTEDRETFEWGRTRFLEEARILARFEHPNIIAVRRFFEANGTAYLVMDYCEGEPLDEIIKREGPLSNARLNNILFPLLDGLEQIHETSFLHRDIKPANLYIRADGSPVLLDFGAARQEIVGHSRSVTSLATPGYAAFEQYSTKGKQGPWTDIYGLGATLYRAVTGEKPQDSPDRILEDTLEPAAIKARDRYPENTLSAIDSAMAIRPDQRPQTVAQWRHMITRPTPAPSIAGHYQASSNVLETPRMSPVTRDRRPHVLLNEKSDIRRALVGFGILGIATILIVIVSFYSGGAVETKPLNLASDSATPKPVAVPTTSQAPACADCPEMIEVPAGAFLMGAGAADVSRNADELPQHLVTFSHSFYLGKYLVTFKEWEACVRDNGCKQQADVGGDGRGTKPVIYVSWYDAQAYVDWLSKKTQQQFRLMSEAEWEYAARAGTSSAYPFEEPLATNAGRYVWYSANANGVAHEVGKKLPNAFGLFDIEGNVWEWTQDCWNDNYTGAPADGSAWNKGNCAMRSVRGGSYGAGVASLRSALRTSSPPSLRLGTFGFRVALGE